jgi:cytidylate kinase
MEFSGGTPLIIEGCGSLSDRASSVAFLRIWLEAKEPVRQSRWREREGNLDKFEMWAAQELDFYAREKSLELADLVITTDS